MLPPRHLAQGCALGMQDIKFLQGRRHHGPQAGGLHISSLSEKNKNTSVHAKKILSNLALGPSCFHDSFHGNEPIMQLFALKIIHLFLTLNFESFRTFPLPETRSFLGSFKWLFSHILSCLHKQSLNLEQTWTWIKDPCLTFWHGGLVFFLNHLPSITVRYASTESAPTSTSQQSFRMQRAWRRFAKKCTHTLYICKKWYEYWFPTSIHGSIQNGNSGADR